MYKNAKDKTWLKGVSRPKASEHSQKRRRIKGRRMKSTNVGAVILRRKSNGTDGQSESTEGGTGKEE